MKSRLIAGLVRLIAGASVRWVNLPSNAEPRVYFANHTSHLDALVIWAALPPAVREFTCPVAARDYWSRGPVRRFLALRLFHSVLVDRHHVTARDNPVTHLVEAIGCGHSLILFPEGTRSSTGEVGPFKCGLYHLAIRKPALDLVPVHIDNLNRILPRGEFLPVPLLSCVTFGPSIRLREGESKSDFLERARQAVIHLKSV